MHMADLAEGVNFRMVDVVKQNTLRCFDHLERMKEVKVTKKNGVQV